jgi:hypothetical protein
MKTGEKLRREIYLRIFLFSLFQKKIIPASERQKPVESEDETADSFSRIRCPLCRWQPRASNRWYCADAGFPEFYAGGCGTAWNTFATRGVCPGCRHRWRWTTCLRCYKNSLHEDWYAEKKED